MRKLIFISMLFIATRLDAQQLNLQSLDKFADQAKEKVVMDLDQATLQFASSFLSSDKKDEAAARKISSGLKGIFVRVFQFERAGDRKSTRLNSSHGYISYAVFCLKKKK